MRKEFTYEIPDGLRVDVGVRVAAPFGKAEHEGTVVTLLEASDVERTRPLKGVVEKAPRVDEGALGLARWMADRYLSSFGQAIDCTLPSGVRKGTGVRKVAWARLVREPASTRGKQAEAIAELRAGPVRARPVHRALAKAGCVEIERVELPIGPAEDELFGEEEPAALTAEQARAMEAIEGMLDRHRVILLQGVTGSGKTEVYIRALRKVIASGRQGLYLLPEIALSAQLYGRVNSRIPRVALLHSQMSEGARAKQWREAREGLVDVVMGARSAVFTPLKAAGVIILDEEHDGSYKEHNAPRYHARDVAIERARRLGIPVILGGATPSIESRYRADAGEYTYLNLPERIGGRRLPKTEIVDLNLERVETKRPVLLSRALSAAVKAEVAAGRQVMIFLNRRGYTTSILCPRCRWVMRCPSCEVSMTYHRATGKALCHYCMRGRPVPPTCPECKKAPPRQIGAGTEKIEEEVKRLLPGVGVLRMDSDAMTSRALYRDALATFRDGKAQVLIGTKMIAKGLHFPNVTLVGVVNADTAFQLPDFRCAETTFQELTQVSGRPGRGDVEGRVLIQTWNPAHYSIQTAKTHDYEAFYKHELAQRRELIYPPFGSLIRLLFEAFGEDRVRDAANEFVGRIRLDGAGEILGPVAAPIYRLKGRYRVHALVKAREAEAARRAIVKAMEIGPVKGGVDLTIDVDPYDAR